MNVGRALHELDAPIVAADQEPNHPEVHQSDIAQVQDIVGAIIIHFRSNAGDLIGLNPPTQSELGHTSAAVLFNSQHFMLPLSRGPSRTYQVSAEVCPNCWRKWL